MACSAPKFVIQAVVWASFLSTGCASPGFAQTISKHPRHDLFADAVSYCRARTRDIPWNDERTILCFNGPILADLDLTPILNLNNSGLFVVRGEGGDVVTAMKIADMLRDRNASVVIYDYCLSACAGFIFIASAETYVTRGTVVAWHAPSSDRSIKQHTHAELQRLREA
jgi:hypothetical protein